MPTNKPQTATSANVVVFAGDSARQYWADRTNARSPGFEVFRPRRTLRRLFVEAAVLIAAGLFILTLAGKAMQ